MTEEELIQELPKGLLRWMEFRKNSNGLMISTKTSIEESLAQELVHAGISLEIMSEEQLVEQAKSRSYDYLVIANALEISHAKQTQTQLLNTLQRILKPEGKLLIMVENRFGIRYFCGDQDPYTERSFDGIEDYKRVSKTTLRGKLFSKAQLKQLLETAGFHTQKYYSVFPELQSPQVIIAEEYSPNEELNIRIFPSYHHPESVFLEEENLYTSLIENGLFHGMANGFFIECYKESNRKDALEQALQITLSMDRGNSQAFATILTANEQVIKIPMYQEGREKVSLLEENNQYLLNQHIPMIEGVKQKDSFIMPLVKGIPLVSYYKELLRQDSEQFFLEFDNLWKLILQSSPLVENHEQINEEYILERGYADLVLVNGLMTNQGIVFFDQEEYRSNLPAQTIMLRNIDFLYHGEYQLEQTITKEALYRRYHIDQKLGHYQSLRDDFLAQLRNEQGLKNYYKQHRRNPEIIHSNRQRMNFSTPEYLKLFVHLFSGVENKDIYIFGTGKFAKKFLEIYGEEYKVTAFLDNNPLVQNTLVNGIAICAPSIISNLDPNTYKVIICVKNYVPILQQVKELGGKHIGIYDTNMTYPIEHRTVLSLQREEGEKKIYGVGYVAGVFDLFHMGHLNLLKKAKEMCHYLIVGVVSDEGVEEKKKTVSFVPFQERIEIVRACKYVDEAVKVPLEYNDTKDAYLKYQFDVQFSGSDYENDEKWKEKKEYLNAQGSELIFFPYTESVSSTMRKEMLVNTDNKGKIRY